MRIDRRGFVEMGVGAAAVGAGAWWLTQAGGAQAPAVMRAPFTLRISFIGLCAYIRRNGGEDHTGMNVGLVNYRVNEALNVPPHYPLLEVPAGHIASSSARPWRRRGGMAIWGLTGYEMSLEGLDDHQPPAGPDSARQTPLHVNRNQRAQGGNGCIAPPRGRNWNTMAWVPSMKEMLTLTGVANPVLAMRGDLYTAGERAPLSSWVRLGQGALEAEGLDTDDFEDMQGAHSVFRFATRRQADGMGVDIPMSPNISLKEPVRYEAQSSSGAVTIRLHPIGGAGTQGDITISLLAVNGAKVACRVTNEPGGIMAPHDPGLHATLDHFKVYYDLLREDLRPQPDARPVPYLSIGQCFSTEAGTGCSGNDFPWP